MRIYTKEELPQHLENGTANPDWLNLRASRFSGSDFYLFMSLLEKGKLTDTAESKLYEKALASLGEEVSESITSAAMEKGTELEPFARELYVEETFEDVREVGFVDCEVLRAGCSPDGIIYANSGSETRFGELLFVQGESAEQVGIKKIIEIKCPDIKNYVKMVAQHKIPTAYKVQMQYNLFATGAKCCDFVVYHPDMKLYIETVYPDEQIQKEIVQVLEKLNPMYDDIVKDLNELKK